MPLAGSFRPLLHAPFCGGGSVVPDAVASDPRILPESVEKLAFRPPGRYHPTGASMRHIREGGTVGSSEHSRSAAVWALGDEFHSIHRAPAESRLLQ